MLGYIKSDVFFETQFTYLLMSHLRQNQQKSYHHLPLSFLSCPHVKLNVDHV